VSIIHVLGAEERRKAILEYNYFANATLRVPILNLIEIVGRKEK
jgi:hypothetical protein